MSSDISLSSPDGTRTATLKYLDEIADAFEWYERNRAGLGDAFLGAVREALDRICENPTGFPKVHRDVRRTLLRTFPYSVLHRHSPVAESRDFIQQAPA